MKKVCIVTPDTVGPINNGGIGTHTYWLSRHLAELGHQVKLYFVGPCQNKTTAYWKEFYSEINVDYVSIEELPGKPSTNHAFLVSSARIMEDLKRHDFDCIHFQDWQACGFHTIRAKKTGIGFQKTQLTVTMHSSTEWINDGMQQWSHDPLRETAQMWAERYCCEHADLLISPSAYLIDWTQNRGWKLSENQKVVQYISLPDEKSHSSGERDYNHLIFFGRLETRKGIDLFLDALEIVFSEDPQGFKQVSFLGKDGWVGERQASHVIQEFFADKAITFEICEDFDTFEAMQYIKQSGGTVVIPSLMDNLPFTVIECIQNGIPLIASDTGGIREMLDNNHLFDLNAKSLAKKLQSIQELFRQPPKHLYSVSKAKQGWSEIAQQASNVSTFHVSSNESPLVSICIPFYNYGKYLAELEAAIVGQDYQNYEVIVVNDGSTDPETIRAFDELRRNPPARWRCFSKENGGVGQTRNFAVQQAKGEYLVFMDADNIAKPHMISTFVRSMAITQADCLTCHFDAFSANQPLASDTKPIHTYLPMGACLEVGLFENVFGDANFVIKRNVFEALGGFREDRDTSWEDYEFLAMLNLAGYHQDVIPESLFWYRETPEGWSRNTDYYRNTNRVVRQYVANLPPYAKFLLEGISLPMARRAKEPEPTSPHQRIQPTILKVARETQRILEQFHVLPVRLRRAG
jgi:glycosyltransferase involved in cell wall biosynthesis